MYTDAHPHAVPRPRPLVGGPGGLAVSTEALVYALLTVAALALRLVRLDWMPLDPGEAALALPAWLAAHVPGAGVPVGSALLFQLERFALWLLPGGTSVARLVPALAGTLAVALAYRLRPALGRSAALAAATLLAVSPLWVFYGRNVSGVSLATAAFVALLGAASSRFARDAVVVPVAAALALAAGSPTFAACVALVVWGAWRYGRPGGGGPRLREDVEGFWPTPAHRRVAGGILVGALALAATGLLTRPDGAALLIDSPVAWAGQLVGDASARLALLLSLGVYAPVTVVFGIVGAAIGMASDRPLARFLGVWAVVGVLFAVLAGGPAGMPDALLPLTLAAAVALGRLVEATAERFGWLEDGVMTGILLVVVGYALLQLWTFGKAGDVDLGSQNLVLALGSLALGGLLVVLFALLWGWSLAGRVAGWVVVLALAVFAWANGTSLDYRPSQLLREPMRPVYAAPGAEGVAGALAMASWTRTRDPLYWATVVDPDLSPELAWVLRERTVRWAMPVAPVTEPTVVVDSGTADGLGPGAYRGQTYIVGGVWRPAFADRLAFVRWLFQRRPRGEETDLSLVQADLYVVVEEGEG